MPTLVERFKYLRYRIFYGLLLDHSRPLISLGEVSTECRWTFCPEGLSSDSVVYAGGVGNDITFEHEIVKNFGCSVVLFDPSPTGKNTMSLPENQNPKFQFHPVGLAGECGTLQLAPPINEEEGSWFMDSTGGATVEVPCLNLATLMQRCGHSHIDLLKIDIEGAEYGVLDDLLAHRLSVKQILVEFHHGMLPGYRRSQTIRLIVKMRLAGYRLLVQDGQNHTFVKGD